MCLCGCEKDSNFPIDHLTGRAELRRRAYIDRLVYRTITIAVIAAVVIGGVYFFFIPIEYWPGY